MPSCIGIDGVVAATKTMNQAWPLHSMSVRFDLGEVTLCIIDPNSLCEKVD
jgi:hypothetical protein